MKTELWGRSFAEKSVPKYPCPSCKHGILRLAGKVAIKEPAFSEKNHSHEEFEFDWVVERVNLHLDCDEPACGERVNITGRTVWVEEYDEEEGWAHAQEIEPTSFYPAPPIIDIPPGTPSDAVRALKQAFAVTWVDTGSAANRIRVSVELVLDALGVPHTTKSKKTGATVDLDLNGRIQWLENNAGQKGKQQASSFHALRVAGNAGSHNADEVSWHDLLDAFLLYESALEDFFGNKGAMIEKAKSNLNKLKKKKGNP